jgi:hypothetical protein
MKLLFGALVGLAILPVTLLGQDDKRLRFTVAGVAGQQIVQSHTQSLLGGDVNTRLSGAILGAEGVLISDRLMVRVRYGEGQIKPKTGSSTVESRDIVMGEALFGVRATPWLSLWVGPSARAYTIGDSDQRWLVWSGRASARGTLLPGRMQSYVELWGVFSGSVGDPPIKAAGRGARGGLEVRFGAQSSFWGRLGYGIESLHAEGLRETAELLTLSIVHGLPQ